MTIDELNEAIRTIKNCCYTHALCTECPMNNNCNEIPSKWEEVNNNDVR